MHCKACDKFLSDREATRKDERTGLYLDLCDNCFDPDIDYFSDIYCQEYIKDKKSSESNQ